MVICTDIGLVFCADDIFATYNMSLDEVFEKSSATWNK